MGFSWERHIFCTPLPGAAVHHAKTGSTMRSAADTPHRGKHTPRPKTPRKNAAHTATPPAHKHLMPPRCTPHPHTMQHTMQHTPTIVNRPFLSPHGEAPPPRSEPSSVRLLSGYVSPHSEAPAPHMGGEDSPCATSRTYAHMMRSEKIILI